MNATGVSRVLPLHLRSRPETVSSLLGREFGLIGKRCHAGTPPSRMLRRNRRTPSSDKAIGDSPGRERTERRICASPDDRSDAIRCGQFARKTLRPTSYAPEAGGSLPSFPVHRRCTRPARVNRRPPPPPPSIGGVLLSSCLPYRNCFTPLYRRGKINSRR